MFKKYNSIENTYRTEFLDKIKSHGFWGDQFVVQEKAHGANLSYWTTNGVDFHSSKRTGAIELGEKFYNHDLVLQKIQSKLEQIWLDLKEEINNLEQVTIFGELIGGSYPHPDVLKDKNGLKAQQGIFYSPSNQFYAFDILINGHKYLDVEVANSFFQKQDLLHAKTLFSGSIIDCLGYSNEFNSTIPSELNLPEIIPNIAEGVIIKPNINRHFNNKGRVILKNKNEKWSENIKFNKTIKKEDEISDQIIKLREAILTYVTENRLNNVLSKIGTVSEKDAGKILGIYSKDVVEDFMKDFHHITDELEKKELKLITKSFSKRAFELVENFLNAI
jgi:Rnl2 family RNA ligase